MTIELKTIEKEGYLEIICSGNYNIASLFDTIDRALDIGEDKNAQIVLLDFNNIFVGGQPPNTMERYDFGENLAKIQLRHEKKIFLVIVGKAPLIDPEKFGETVAINRGARGKVFIEMEEALNWIKDRSSTKNTT